MMPTMSSRRRAVRPSRTRTDADRRGATLVLVAVMITVLGGMVALGLEFARLQAGSTELQTATDAAALSGAHRMRVAPAEGALAAVTAMGRANDAFGVPLALGAADVVPGRWSPTMRRFTAAPWSTATAVRVTGRRRVSLAFGAFAGLTSVDASHTTVAWVGTLAAADCTAPWGIERALVESRLGTALGTVEGNAALRRALANRAGRARMTLLLTPTGGGGDGTVTALAPNGGGLGDHEAALAGTHCDGIVGLSRGDVSAVVTAPGVAAATVRAATSPHDVSRWWHDAPTLCAPSADARCLHGVRAGADVTVPVAYIDRASGSAAITQFGGFTILCLYRGLDAGTRANPAERCPALAAFGRPDAGLAPGTLVGHPAPMLAPLGPGNRLDDGTGLLRTVVLAH